jgi:LPXTG-motif cell wall-anchored protein
MEQRVEQPVGTTGTVRSALPKTASSLPLVGLIGLMSLAGGLTLHVFGRRRVGRA